MRAEGLPILRVTCALILDQGRLLAARRGPGMPEAGWWEFPGGKLEADESAEACLRRELHEELGIEVEIEAALPPVRETQPQRILELIPFVCQLRKGEPVAHEHDRLQWLEAQDYFTPAWIPIDARILAAWVEARS